MRKKGGKRTITKSDLLPVKMRGRDEYEFSREQQFRQQQVARLHPDDVDKMSTALIDAGVYVVKKNPIKTSLYFVGLLICLLFNGFSVDTDVVKSYEKDMREVDFQLTDEAYNEMQVANSIYRKSSGWFTCDDRCQAFKSDFMQKEAAYKSLLNQEREQLRDAKSKLGKHQVPDGIKYRCILAHMDTCTPIITCAYLCTL